MGELILEDRLLNHHANSTLHEFMPIIDNIQIMISKNPDSKEIRNLAEKTISIYGGIYKSIQEKTKSAALKNSGSDSFFKLHATYVACEGTKQLLKNGYETDISLSIADGYSANSYYVDVSRSDSAALADTFRIIGDSLGYSSNTHIAKNNILSTLDKISQVTVKRIFASPNSVIEYLNINVKGKNLEVKKPTIQNSAEKTNSLEKDTYSKGLEDYVSESIRAEDIVANKSGIKLLNQAIPCVMHYDSIVKKNSFNNFAQWIIFVGQPGTGKTMLAKYGMTLAKDIALENKLDLSIVKLDFADRYQMGPLINLKKQLSQISSGDMPYVVFMDEIDKKFPSGSDSKEYMDQVVGELLRFRGGSEYPNYNNYLILGTTNSPERLHKGLIDASTIINVEGPTTTDERLKVLRMNLNEGIESGYVNISNEGWNLIKSELHNKSLTGRNLKNIASSALQKYLNIASNIKYGQGYNQDKNDISKIVSSTNSSYVTTEIQVIDSIRQEAEKMKSVHSYV